MSVGGRKRFNPETILYDLDVSLVQRMLGKPGKPERQVKRLLNEIAKDQTTADSVSKVSEEAEDLVASINSKLTSEEKVLLQRVLIDGVMFIRVSAATENKNSALDASISRAFAAAKLDAKRPNDWYRLLSRFCWAHFGEKGKPGRARTWSDANYCRLLRAVHQAKSKCGALTDAEAFRHLIKSKKYNLSMTHLKKALREARDPEYNRALIQPMYKALTAELDRGVTWPKSQDKKIRARFARAEADRIGASQLYD